VDHGGGTVGRGGAPGGLPWPTVLKSAEPVITAAGHQRLGDPDVLLDMDSARIHPHGTCLRTGGRVLALAQLDT
jgi:hypothetical protein